MSISVYLDFYSALSFYKTNQSIQTNPRKNSSKNFKTLFLDALIDIINTEQLEHEAYTQNMTFAALWLICKFYDCRQNKNRKI